MTFSETRALRHAALLVLGLGLLRIVAEGVRSQVTTQGAVVQDSSGLAVLLDESRGSGTRPKGVRVHYPAVNGSTRTLRERRIWIAYGAWVLPWPQESFK